MIQAHQGIKVYKNAPYDLFLFFKSNLNFSSHVKNILEEFGKFLGLFLGNYISSSQI